MNSDIDFSQYSLDELYESAGTIDREKFPQRAARIDELIREKERLSQDNSTEVLVVRSEVKRSNRLLAALIDAAVSFIASIPFWYFVETDGLSGLSPQIILASLLYGLAVFFILHGYLLFRNAQTIGKFVMGTRIENLDGAGASAGRVLLLRYLPMFLISAIPFAGLLIAGFINPLMIFRDDRRCLHDHVAKTVVSYVAK